MRGEKKEGKKPGLKTVFREQIQFAKMELKLKAIFLPEALLLGKSQLPASRVALTAQLQILHSCTYWQSSASLNALGSVRTW